MAQAGLRTLAVEGAYFLLADIAALPFADDTAFCRHLISEVGVAAIPPSAFYADPRTAPRLARFCFAKPDTTIRLVAQRLPGTYLRGRGLPRTDLPVMDTALLSRL